MQTGLHSETFNNLTARIDMDNEERVDALELEIKLLRSKIRQLAEVICDLSGGRPTPSKRTALMYLKRLREEELL